MIVTVLQVLSILLSALVFGLFWGPWIALTRSIATFPSDVFLAIVHRLDRNIAPVMTVLFPVTLLSIAAVAVVSLISGGTTFVYAIVAFALFLLALVVTAVVEVPIVERIRSWTTSTMPADWQQQRDRWVSFHLLRVIPGGIALVVLVAGAILGGR